VQAQKAALYVHKILQERGGVAPASEDGLYTAFTEASELRQGFRKPLEDWSHQMGTMTIPSAVHTSVGVPVVGLDCDNAQAVKTA
jgi:hypothetical protein